MSFRFNGGAGAIVCDHCGTIIQEPAERPEGFWELAALCATCRDLTATVGYLFTRGELLDIAESIGDGKARRFQTMLAVAAVTSTPETVRACLREEMAACARPEPLEGRIAHRRREGLDSMRGWPASSPGHAPDPTYRPAFPEIYPRHPWHVVGCAGPKSDHRMAASGVASGSSSRSADARPQRDAWASWRYQGGPDPVDVCGDWRRGMSWAKRGQKHRQRVLDALAEIVQTQTACAETPGQEGPRVHREWAGAAQDAIDLLSAAAPAKRAR